MTTRSLLRTTALSGAITLLAATASQGVLGSPFSPTSLRLLAVDPSSPISPFPLPASAILHGITVRLAAEGRVVVAVTSYDGGIPVAGAQVMVFAPGGDTPYQLGSTDPAGLFAFLPGGPGEWRVAVDDGMGHRREAGIDVAEVSDGEEGGDPARPSGPREPLGPGNEADSVGILTHSHVMNGTDRPWKLATGLGLIFGLSGFAYGFTARRERS
jgi:hypothetical protein